MLTLVKIIFLIPVLWGKNLIRLMRDVNMICVSLLKLRLKVSHIYAPEEGYFSLMVA